MVGVEKIDCTSSGALLYSCNLIVTGANGEVAIKTFAYRYLVEDN